jgi:hypothetical protein
MQEQLRARLEELQKEYATDQACFRELQAQQASMTESLLRIEGAILALKEFLERTPMSETSSANVTTPPEFGATA